MDFAKLMKSASNNSKKGTLAALEERKQLEEKSKVIKFRVDGPISKDAAPTVIPKDLPECRTDTSFKISKIKKKRDTDLVKPSTPANSLPLQKPTKSGPTSKPNFADMPKFKKHVAERLPSKSNDTLPNRLPAFSDSKNKFSSSYKGVNLEVAKEDKSKDSRTLAKEIQELTATNRRHLAKQISKKPAETSTSKPSTSSAHRQDFKSPKVSTSAIQALKERQKIEEIERQKKNKEELIARKQRMKKVQEAEANKFKRNKPPPKDDGLTPRERMYKSAVKAGKATFNADDNKSSTTKEPVKSSLERSLRDAILSQNKSLKTTDPTKQLRDIDTAKTSYKAGPIRNDKQALERVGKKKDAHKATKHRSNEEPKIPEKKQKLSTKPEQSFDEMSKRELQMQIMMLKKRLYSMEDCGSNYRRERNRDREVEQPFKRHHSEKHRSRDDIYANDRNYSQPSTSRRNAFIYDDDDEESDDSMASFIDDTELDEYSSKEELKKTLKDLYNYNASKYANDRYDDRSMEVRRYGDIEKEDRRSAYLGRREEMEEMLRGRVVSLG